MRPWLSIPMLLALFSVARAEAPHPLAGIWKYDDGPVWIEIGFQEKQGIGITRRNDTFPEKVDMIFLKEIEPTGREGQWRVMVYIYKLGNYMPATIFLPAPDQMHLLVKVGLVSRNVTWQRSEGFESDD